MVSIIRSETCVQIVIPHIATVQAVLSAAPTSLTLLTPGGAVQVEVRRENLTDAKALTRRRSSP